MKTVDYYEFLQISPNAEDETIHRVYRFLAARYHPDNPESGDAEKFSTLKAAYEVLSDPQRRAEYDSQRGREQKAAVPLSSTIDFMDQLEGENNRRVALLAVLYYKRRFSPLAPEVPLAEIETRMGFPRDYLDFTTWYLQKKGFITKADNSDFTLTAAGVDFVESQRVNIPVLNKLLTSGAENAADERDGHGPEAEAAMPGGAIDEREPGGASHVVESAVSVLPPDAAIPEGARTVERRLQRSDRRTNPQDRRANPVERRMTACDRRQNAGERRANGIATVADSNAGGDSTPGSRRRPKEAASAVDRLIAIVDESMDAIYGTAGAPGNGFEGGLAGSVPE